MFVAWYAPDAVPELTEASRQVASGVTKDRTDKSLTWTVPAFVGSFGSCVETRRNGSGVSDRTSAATRPPAALPFTKVVLDGFAPAIIAAEASPSVRSIRVTFLDDSLDDSDVTLTPIQLGGHSFIAPTIPLGGEIVSAVSRGQDGAILANPDGAIPTRP